MNKRLLLSLFGMLFCAMVMAITVPEKGKYYRIVNKNPEKATNTEGVSIPYAISEDKTSHALTTVAQDEDTKGRYAQIWYCSAATSTTAKFMNARTHQYLSGVATSSQAYTATVGATLTLTNNSTYFLINGTHYYHSDGSNRVVGWDETSNKSDWWDFEEVTVDSTTMLAVYKAYQKEAAEKKVLEAIVAKASTYAPIIQGYFNDYACTDLKAEYSAMSDADFQAKMSADGISETEVQEMVLRIKNKWSTECDPTQSAKFRVQNYTCYPEAGSAKAYTKATQISDMNNITGIWTDALQLLYIFVDSDIPSNATLTITQTSGDQGRAWAGQGTTLHKGLNIVYCGTDLANNWIMYTVPFDKTLSKPIAEYPKVKIHIEGGNVIGYMNTLDENGEPLAEDDCNALWKTQLQYANKVMKANGYSDLSKDRIDFAVKGQRGLMFFPVECYNRIWATTPYNNYYTTNYNIYKSMRFFDNVLKWEWGAMGITKRVVDGEGAPSVSRENMEGGYDIQPTYINNLACAMMIWEGGKNPYSSDGYTSMPGVGAVESSYNAERADFDVWCVGHESGHNNQGTINLPSSMESSNNTFSNICQYQNGYRLSRGMTFMENMDYIPKNTQFAQRSISMTLRMYFNLYLYYHRAKYDTKFYPTLHKLLRDDPMYFGGDGWWEGVGDGNGGANMGKSSNSWLKFYEKVCDAAQEDLTEYFRMWGFFIPSKDAQYAVKNPNNGKWYVYCGDYSSYYIENSQDSINAAIKRVKAKNYPVNKQICFVEDRLVPQKRFDAWDPNGQNWKVTSDGGDASNETTLKSWYGDLGYIGYYEDGKMKIATADDYTYTATGTAVKLTAKKADLGVGIIVYNEAKDSILWMSNRLSFTLPTEVAARKYVISIINADGSEVEAKNAIDSDDPEILKGALQSAIEASKTYTKLLDKNGKNVGFYTEEALQGLTDAVAKGNNAISAGDATQYRALAIEINEEILDVAQNAEKIPLERNGIYYIKNYERGHYLTTAYSCAESVGATTRWALIGVPGEDGYYYLQNNSSKKYVNFSNGYTYNSAVTDATKFHLEEYGDGAFCFGFTNSEGKYRYINETPSWNGTISWDWATGSAWYLTRYTYVDDIDAEMMQNLINDEKALVDYVCDYNNSPVALALQSSDATAKAYVSANIDASGTLHGIDKCLDGKTTTYYESANPDEGVNPSLYVDLGSETTDKLKELIISLRANSYNRPDTLIVWRSNSTADYSKKSWIKSCTFTEMFPTKSVSDLSWTDNTPATNTTAARFWKFEFYGMKDEFSGKEDALRMCKFELSYPNVSVVMKSPYESLSTSLVTTCKTKESAAQDVLDNDPSILSYNTAYTGLKNAYDKLKAAADAIQPVPTGIDEVQSSKLSTEGTIYDLSGRKVNAAGKGFYIIGGKKVVK